MCSYCTCFTGERLAELNIIIVACLALLDRLIALLYAPFVVLHLEVCGGLVVDVRDLVLIELERLVVLLESLRELLLLVELVSLVLDGLGLFLAGNLVPLLGGELLLLLLLLPGLIFSALLGRQLFVLLAEIFLLIFGLHLLGLHVHQVDACQLLEDIHETRVDLDDLHQHLRVLLAQLEGVAEFGVLEVSGDSRVGHKLDHGLGTEHAACIVCSRGSLLLAALLKSLLDLGVVWVQLKTLLKSSDGIVKASKILKSHCATLVTPVPISFDLNAPISVRESELGLAHV